MENQVCPKSKREHQRLHGKIVVLWSQMGETAMVASKKQFFHFLSFSSLRLIILILFDGGMYRTQQVVLLFQNFKSVLYEI